MLDIAVFDMAEPEPLSDEELAMFPLGAAELLLSLEAGAVVRENLSPAERPVYCSRARRTINRDQG